MQRLLDILLASWLIWNETAVYILIGFLLAAALRVWGIGERLIRHIRHDNTQSVVLAAMAGIPLPLCSCGVLPAAIALRRLGAGKGAVVAFLISTPETGVTSILLSYALLGPTFAAFRPFAALTTAVVAGMMVNLLDRHPTKLSSPDCETSLPVIKNHAPTASKHWAWRLYHFAFVDLLDDIAGWLVFGVVLSGMIQTLAPDSLFRLMFGNPLLSMLIILAVSVPLYVCAESSTPIAATLIARGMNPAAAMVLLLAGPATNAASIGLLSQQLGRRAVAIYVATICIVSMIMGLAINGILAISGENIYQRASIATYDALGHVRVWAAIILALLCLVSFYRRSVGVQLMSSISRAIHFNLPKHLLRWTAGLIALIWIATSTVALLTPRNSPVHQRIQSTSSPCPCGGINIPEN